MVEAGKTGKKKKKTQRDEWTHLASFVDRRQPMAASPLVDAHCQSSFVSSLSSSPVSVSLLSKTLKEMKSNLLWKVLWNRLKAKCTLSPFAHSFYFFTNKSFSYCPLIFFFQISPFLSFLHLPFLPKDLRDQYLIALLIMCDIFSDLLLGFYFLLISNIYIILLFLFFRKITPNKFAKIPKYFNLYAKQKWRPKQN